MAYGVEVAVVGALVVFVFLASLVLSVQALGWFFRTFGHRFPEPAGRPAAVGTARGAGTAPVAAIVAAIEARRRGLG